MPADISELTAEVDRTKGLAASAIALINGIADRIDAAVTADNVTDNTNLSALSSSLRTENDALAAALESNP